MPQWVRSGRPGRDPAEERLERVGRRRSRQQRGQQRRGQSGRLEQGFGQGGPSGFFEHADEVDVAQPEAMGRLGHQEPGSAELGQHTPSGARQHAPLIRRRLVEGPQRGNRAFLVQDLAHGLTQLHLFVTEGEVHG